MKIAFVFPGQGSQSIGMMAGFGTHPVVRRTFDEASAVLGEDLWALAEHGPEESLALTTNTQPLMLTADVAVWRAWCETSNLRPAIVAGHSLGEYAALVAAGALTLEDAVPLVRFRAKAMQEAVPEGVGAMAAILGLDDAQVTALCAAQSAPDAVVEAVNFNSPGQVVVAGHKSAVEQFMEAAKEAGAKRAVLLPVSAPFHSSLLLSAAERLAERLRETPFCAPEITLIHNVDVREHDTPDAIRQALAMQAARPVRWTQTLQEMQARGVTHIIECGPGKVLAALTKRATDGITSLTLTDSDAIVKAHESLSEKN
ncbi:MAG: ACP S-malonyltransferase [Burkholderiales bacterium]|jgi:[acyl-carrier-protein] S-malonyltransferase|nr:ACP S-malonyltransferase [Burkholderiales bacterium]